MTNEEEKTLVQLDREIEKHPQDVSQKTLRRYRELLTKHISEASSAPALRVKSRGYGPRSGRQWVA